MESLFRFRQHNGLRTRLLTRVQVSGASALRTEEPLRRQLGLAAGTADLLLGYVDADRADDLVRDFAGSSQLRV